MKDIFSSYVGYLVIMVGNLLVGVLTARLLLPVGRGELGQVMLWPSLIAVLGAFSINDALVYFLAQRQESPRAALGSAITIGVLLSLPLGIIGLVMVPLVFGKMPPDVRLAAYLYVAYIPIGFVGTYIVSMFQGLMRFGHWNLLRALLSLSNLVYALTAWLLFGASVLGFTAAVLLANITVTLLGAVLLARRGWFGVTPRVPLMTGMLGFGFRIHLSDMLGLASQRVDQILVTQWLPTQDYGYYLVALSVWGTASGLVVLLGQLVFPKVAAEALVEAKMAALGRYMRLAVALSVSGSLLLILLAPWLVRLVFGPHFTPAGPIVQILALATAPTACRQLLAQAFKALGRPNRIILAEGVGLVAMLVALFLLLPPLGLEGAAIALVVGQTVVCGTLAFNLKRGVGSRLRPLFVPTAADVRFVMLRLREMRQRPAAP